MDCMSRVQPFVSMNEGACLRPVAALPCKAMCGRFSTRYERTQEIR